MIDFLFTIKNESDGSEADMQERFSNGNSSLLNLCGEIQKLQTENEKLRACVEFYAKEDNWHRTNKTIFSGIKASDIELAKNKEVAQVYYKNLEVGGKCARQILRELKEGKE